MSAVLAEQARAKAKAKINNYLRDPKTPVDASSFTESEAENGSVQTGPRPVSRRQFKRGGHVMPEGKYTTIRADRKKRAAGGNIGNQYENRNIKQANESRDGTKQTGGMAHGGSCNCSKCSGGRVGKSAGGVLFGGTRPQGGRMPRASGGRAKKGTNINIIVAPSGGQKPAMPPPMAPPPGGPPPGGLGLHQGMPPPPMAPGAGAPPPMGMGHARGGRTGYPLKDGAGGGMGRRQKIAAYGG
jgi:hypothetical protein